MNTQQNTSTSATVQQDALEDLIAQGLPALKAGLEEAKKHIDDIIDAATNPKLKQMLQQGKQTSEQWAQRVKDAMEEAGANGQGDNPIIEAHGEVAQRIRREAPTDGVRDLGIIASGQLALHYWIAAFGTMASYCKSTDMMDTAESLAECVDDAKQADEMHTDLAYEMMGRSRGQSSQNGSGMGTTSVMGGSTSGMGGSTSGMGGSTSGMGGSTSGMGGSTSGMGGSTSGMGGSTSGMGGSTSGMGGATVNQQRVSEFDGTQSSNQEFSGSASSNVAETMGGNSNAELDMRDLRGDELNSSGQPGGSFTSKR